MPRQTHKFELSTGDEARFEIVERTGKRTVRLDVEAPTGERWRIEAEDSPDEWEVDLLGGWDSAGELADVPLPDWLDEILYRLQ